MASSSWPVYSPFAKEHFGRGKTEGRADAVLTILGARGIDVPEEARDRIRACTDDEQLDVWLKRAVVADSVADLLD